MQMLKVVQIQIFENCLTLTLLQLASLRCSPLQFPLLQINTLPLLFVFADKHSAIVVFSAADKHIAIVIVYVSCAKSLTGMTYSAPEPPSDSLTLAFHNLHIEVLSSPAALSRCGT